MSATPRKARSLRSVGIPEGFRVRGEEISRVEGFSDAAFAFALTLLVMSLEVPSSFSQLMEMMRGVAGFAACFAILFWLWISHYKFFRRYGLEDTLTIFLNSVLLFVILLYVYPLKFVFTIFMGMLMHLAFGLAPPTTADVENYQVDDLFIIYGVGFIAVFALLGLMNLRAWKLREALDLNEVERVVTREEITRCWCMVGIGALSVLLAIALSRGGTGAAGMAGFAYGLTGVVEFILGAKFGTKRENALKNMRQRGEWPA